MDSLPFFLYLFYLFLLYLFLFLLYLFPAGSQRSLCRLRGQPTLPVLRLLRMLLQRSQVSCVVLCVCWWHVLDVAACYFVMQQWRGGLCWQQRLGLECCLCAWWWSCDIVGAIVALLPPTPHPPPPTPHPCPHPTPPPPPAAGAAAAVPQEPVNNGPPMGVEWRNGKPIVRCDAPTLEALTWAVRQVGAVFSIVLSPP